MDIHDVTREDAHTMAVHAHAETFDPKVESLFRYLQVSAGAPQRTTANAVWQLPALGIGCVWYSVVCFEITSYPQHGSPLLCFQ